MQFKGWILLEIALHVELYVFYVRVVHGIKCLAILIGEIQLARGRSLCLHQIKAKYQISISFDQVGKVFSGGIIQLFVMDNFIKDTNTFDWWLSLQKLRLLKPIDWYRSSCLHIG